MAVGDVLLIGASGDQEFAPPPVYRQVNRILTSPELLALADTPIVLVAGVAGKVYLPIDATFVYYQGATAYAGGVTKFQIGSVAAANFGLEIEATNWFKESTPATDYFAAAPLLGPGLSAFSVELDAITGDALSIMADSNPTLGDGTVDVAVTYRVIDIP